VTVGEKLGYRAIQVQEAWISLTESWTQTVEDLVDSASVDPLALLRPDVAMDQAFAFAQRAFQIQQDLISHLTGLSRTAQVTVGQEVAVISTAVAAPADPPIDVVVSEIEPAPRAAVPAAKYSRVSKAELQKVLTDRNLPATGTIKELRGRLIEADRQPEE
jgi:hypothetical protein